MDDPTPHARRSPMEHERDAGSVSLLDMIVRLTAERDALLACTEDAAKIAEGHMVDPALGLTEWGQGHNAACQQVAHEIRRRFKF